MPEGVLKSYSIQHIRLLMLDLEMEKLPDK